MSAMTKQEQAAIEAVAGHFSGIWEKGEDPPDAYVDIAGRRIAVEVATANSRDTLQTKSGRTRHRLCKSMSVISIDMSGRLSPDSLAPTSRLISYITLGFLGRCPTGLLRTRPVARSTSLWPNGPPKAATQLCYAGVNIGDTRIFSVSPAMTTVGSGAAPLSM